MDRLKEKFTEEGDGNLALLIDERCEQVGLSRLYRALPSRNLCVTVFD